MFSYLTNWRHPYQPNHGFAADGRRCALHLPPDGMRLTTETAETVAKEGDRDDTHEAQLEP